jgi:hypothetical protein
MNCVRDLCSNRLGACVLRQMETSQIQTWNIARPESAKVRRRMFAKQRVKLLFNSVSNPVAFGRRKAVKHQFVNVQIDVHDHPPISASVNGRSSFAYSLRAARNKWAIDTDSSSSAAMKAAWSAML